VCFGAWLSPHGWNNFRTWKTINCSGSKALDF
jgi:hypothetical protein